MKFKILGQDLEEKQEQILTALCTYLWSGEIPDPVDIANFKNKTGLEKNKAGYFYSPLSEKKFQLVPRYRHKEIIVEVQKGENFISMSLSSKYNSEVLPILIELLKSNFDFIEKEN